MEKALLHKEKNGHWYFDCVTNDPDVVEEFVKDMEMDLDAKIVAYKVLKLED